MGLKDLFKGFKDDDAYEQDGYADEYTGGYNDQAEEENNAAEPAYSAPVESSPAPVNISGSAIELKVVRPESFKNADQIAEHLLARRTVVLNLEATAKDTAKRLIDFLSGVAFAIKGDIRKVSNNTYVITPGNVTVTGDPMTEAAKGAEENAEEEETPYRY
ncbi:MAG: cell division protein SepF [Clostridia bacterium]|nr:cell division protein SepF [Clostridia bacterium]MBQ4298587.1 cell division protein SepF [Clostridia bacterium]